MHVQDIMTQNPTCCGPDTSVQAAAKMMMDNDCGEIPVLDDKGMPIGVITDRDIACRCVAEGKAHDTRVGDVMSSPVVTVTATMSIADCCATMEENQIRRVPVVDDAGKCCGMVSQADVALGLDTEKTGQLVRDMSKPNHDQSHTD
ncbi:MAG: CBS domain-containing protein [Sphingomonadales bacterium 28-55-16]|nr:MAG: CBS domain-containing protein [Sphingomonadales bacterium 28-55-16]